MKLENLDADRATLDVKNDPWSFGAANYLEKVSKNRNAPEMFVEMRVQDQEGMVVLQREEALGRGLP